MKKNGFTLVELIIVIVVLGVLAIVVAPKLTDISADAKRAKLNSLAANIKSMAKLAQAKALASGLIAAKSNPGGAEQAAYAIDFGFGVTEVDWRNLCPESRAEVADKLGMLDFLDIENQEFETYITNTYLFIGYDIADDRLDPNAQGCYLIYDSTGLPDCTVRVIDNGC